MYNPKKHVAALSNPLNGTGDRCFLPYILFKNGYHRFQWEGINAGPLTSSISSRRPTQR